MARFFQYHLRTTDVAAAKTFYAAALGRDESVVMPLHEQALAKGARPHWLGYVGVDDVDRALDAFRARGAMQLGPRAVNPAGLDMVVLRDPAGAVVALARATPNPTFPEVVWHHLSTADLDTSAASYRELFGWEVSPPKELPRLGAVRELAWTRGAEPFGSMADITGHPEVHPHWLFHFRVESLDDTITKVKALGGAVLPPFTLDSGARVAVCDDPQGAAFALYEAALGA